MMLQTLVTAKSRMSPLFDSDHPCLIVLVSLYIVFAASAHGDDKSLVRPAPKPVPVESYLKRLYEPENQRFSFTADYSGGFDQWQADARPLLQQLLGLDVIVEQAGDHQPTVEHEDSIERDGYSIQRGTIETEPDIFIPFWLLRPQGEGPFPLAILPHGHDRLGHDTYAGVFHNESHAKDSLAQDRDVAVQAVKRGYLAIAPAVRGLATEADKVPDAYKRHGERACRSHLMHCILAGRTAVGERVWDMSRLIDWAGELPEVDAREILMMGNSGGGVVTLYAAACDERITVAVPSCSFSVIASEEGRIFHCDCCAIPGILEGRQTTGYQRNAF